MEQLVWETAEELDQKLAQRVPKDQKTAFYFSDEISFYEWCKLWFDQKV